MTENTELVPAGFNALANSGGNDYSEELAKFLGQGGPGQSLMLPVLKINKDYEDDEETGTKLTPGTFMVAQDGVEYYTKKALFRPYMQTYQVTEYDPDEKKFVGKTIQIKNFSEEMIDTTGGTRLGKMKSKDKRQLDENDPRVKADKNKQMYRYVYGTVRMPDAVGRDGKKNPLETPIPCMIKLRGNNFMPYQDEYLDLVEKARKLQPQFETELSLERKKNGDTTYYIIHFDFNQNKALPLTGEDVELIKKFEETVQFENKQVWEQYNKALGTSSKNQEADDFVKKFAEGGLDDDFPESDV
jgi:hypothetical protein